MQPETIHRFIHGFSSMGRFAHRVGSRCCVAAFFASYAAADPLFPADKTRDVLYGSKTVVGVPFDEVPDAMADGTLVSGWGKRVPVTLDDCASALASGVHVRTVGRTAEIFYEHKLFMIQVDPVNLFCRATEYQILKRIAGGKP